MKKLVCLILCTFVLCGCRSNIQHIKPQRQYSASFITLFDTVTTIVGKAESEKQFQEIVQPIHDELEYYHKLFDIYHDYEGINNLKTVNDKAHIAPVKVDAAIIELLLDCKEYYTATDGLFNPAMGSVLSLWHKARENGLNDPANASLPDADALKAAALHTNFSDIVLNIQESTVFIKDEKLKLDVGGIAKGWAVQRVCSTAQSGLLISVGGNIYATGPKDSESTPWAVGIRDPDGKSDSLHVLNITHGSVVTSGSYQRAYAVNGKSYHHIIDPNTLYPSELWTSVSIVSEDSGLADVLSTTLFLLDLENGQQILDKYSAEALWVDNNGNKYYSKNFKSYIKK